MSIKYDLSAGIHVIRYNYTILLSNIYSFNQKIFKAIVINLESLWYMF